MNIILFDTPQARVLLEPFSYTRALGKLRIGITTIEEKWRSYLQGDYSFLTAPYLSDKFPCTEAALNLCINGTICPDPILVEAIRQLKNGQRLIKGDLLIAVLCDRATLQDFKKEQFDVPHLQSQTMAAPVTHIKHIWDIVLRNEREISNDIQWLTEGRPSQPIQDEHTITYNSKDIFVEEGVSVKASFLDATLGPIYLGKDATLEAATVINGPVAIGEGARIKSGAKVEHATTVGPFASIGGEIHNSVILDYSNKAYEGFMGHSVIGAWCNLEAGTSVSNISHDGDQIRIWDEYREMAYDTGMQFCGLFMGDYSRSAMGTMFNAGTVVGVSSNLFGMGFFDRVIPSFTRGMAGDGVQTYRLDKALNAIERIMSRRSATLSEIDQKILAHLFLVTAIYRN